MSGISSSNVCYGVIKKTAPHRKYYGWMTVFSQPLHEDVFFHFSSLAPDVTSIGIGDECSFYLSRSDTRTEGKNVMAENIKILPPGTLKREKLRPEVYSGLIEHPLMERKPGEEPEGGRVRLIKIKSPKTAGSRAPQIGTVFQFSGRDLHEELIGPQLHKFLMKGDEVEFQIYDCLVPRKCDRALRATRICIEKLGGHRYYGIVDRIPPSRKYDGGESERAFGWIKFVEPEREEIHFRFDRILTGEHPEIGDEVEFSVELDNLQRPGATRILFVPRGTCAHLIDTHIREGVVVEGPRLHVADEPRNTASPVDRDVNTFLGGAIDFMHPETQTVCRLPCFLKSKYVPPIFDDFKPKDSPTPVPRLLPGDRVIFNLNIYKKDRKKQYISDIEVIIPTYKFKLIGVVTHFSASLGYYKQRNRPNSRTGLIKIPEPFNTPEVFFHINECDRPEEIRANSEVEFDMTYNSKDRPVAVRIKKLPNNTITRTKIKHKDVEGVAKETKVREKGKRSQYHIIHETCKYDIFSKSMTETREYEYLEDGVALKFDIYRDLFGRCDVLKNVRFKTKPTRRPTRPKPSPKEKPSSKPKTWRDEKNKAASNENSQKNGKKTTDQGSKSRNVNVKTTQRKETSSNRKPKSSENHKSKSDNTSSNSRNKRRRNRSSSNRSDSEKKIGQFASRRKGSTPRGNRRNRTPRGPKGANKSHAQSSDDKKDSISDKSKNDSKKPSTPKSSSTPKSNDSKKTTAKAESKKPSSVPKVDSKKTISQKAETKKASAAKMEPKKPNNTPKSEPKKVISTPKPEMKKSIPASKPEPKKVSSPKKAEKDSCKIY